MSAPDGRGPVPDLDARILYEANGVVVVDKPPGLPTSGRTLEDPDCLQFWLVRRARRTVWAVHQLDADTSGVNVFVTRKSLVPAWQRRLRFPTARKRYVAIVHGEPAWDRRRVVEPIGFVQTAAWRGWGVTPDGKPAATRFEVVDRSGGFAVLWCELETGRTHQIRVHLRHEGLSLVGEEWYREPACTLHGRQALHAERITFTDGLDPGLLRAPVPADLVELAASLGLALPG